MKLDVAINGIEKKITVEKNRFTFGGVEREFSMETSGPGIVSVLIEGRSYQATVLGPGEIQVNGRIFHVEVFDPRELRTRSGGSASEGRQSIVSPMPGKIVRILKSAGDTVEAGEGLIVVEAMKMQNEMKSPKSGRVSEIKAKDGATVGAGEVLMVVE
jgi:biotin carboxyl carrier protein